MEEQQDYRAWTREDDKLFERALLVYPHDTPDRWAAIAAQMPGGRTPAEVHRRYHMLLQDLRRIDQGMVQTPGCWGGHALVPASAAPAAPDAGTSTECRGSTKQDDNLFERALLIYAHGTPDRWAAIAAQLPGGSTAAEVQRRYHMLLQDLRRIDQGLVQTPMCWGGLALAPAPAASDAGTSKEYRAWTKQDDKLFESALMVYPHDTPDRWAAIAAQMPSGRTPAEVQKRYQYHMLLQDLRKNDQRLVQKPDCWDGLALVPAPVAPDTGSSTSEQRRETSGRGSGRVMGNRSGPWSPDEHKLFLLGLMKYGKGDWRSISREVVTKSPSQVASHAQKYFLRQKQNADKANGQSRRTSIHDITSP